VFSGASLPDRPGRWDVVVEGGVVTALTKWAGQSRAGGAAVAGEVADLDGALVSRPFVDVHMHLDKAFQDGVVNESGTLDEAIRLAAARKAELRSHDHMVATILRGVRAAVLGGTTAMRTHIDVDAGSGLAALRAALDARSRLPAGVRLELVAFPQEGLGGGVLPLLEQSLEMGCDAIGGIPARQADPLGHIRDVFAIATRWDVPVDMHIDESDDPDDRTLVLLAEETVRNGWEGRVVAGHCCSLVAQRPDTRLTVIEQVRDAGIHVVTLPSTNLHLQGRADAVAPRRGLTSVTELLDAGVNVAYASDNIRDAFNPFGNGRMVETGLLLAHAAHMGGSDRLDDVFAMATVRPMAVMAQQRWSGDAESHVTVGAAADLLVFPATSSREVVVGQHHPSGVYLAGERVVWRHEQLEVAESLRTLDVMPLAGSPR
jgi:cytosine deaminase